MRLSPTLIALLSGGLTLALLLGVRSVLRKPPKTPVSAVSTSPPALPLPSPLPPTLLQPVAPPSVTPTPRPEETAAALRRYLDAVDPTKNPRMTAVTLADLLEAFRILTDTGQAGPLEKIVDSLRQNLAALEAAPAFEAVQTIHDRYLAATRALVADAAILLRVRSDTPRAEEASARIENLRPALEAILRDLEDLAAAYGISG